MDMECTRIRIYGFLCLEISALLLFICCIILQTLNGVEFSFADVLFITSVLTVCIIILVVTICFCVTSTTRNHKNISEREPIISDDVISRKLKTLYDKLDNDCPICLSSMHTLAVQLSCKHDFHEQCIREWFARSRGFRCPGCRRVCSDQPEKNNIRDSPNLHKIELCSIKSIPPSENV